MNKLTAFQRDLLYVIGSADDQSGQLIKETLERDYHTGINHGRLYPNLDVLVDGGFVEKGEIDRRTNSYTLTDEG